MCVAFVPPARSNAERLPSVAPAYTTPFTTVGVEYPTLGSTPKAHNSVPVPAFRAYRVQACRQHTPPHSPLRARIVSC
jgi:hypothetical protein